jgi:hypothetical protein
MIVLALVACATLAFAATAQFPPTPTGTTGQTFIVVNFARAASGLAQHTSIKVDWGNIHRNRIFAPPYGVCGRTTPAGIVLKIRQSSPETMTVTTNGTIVRAPQSEPPLELLSPCYTLKL